MRRNGGMAVKSYTYDAAGRTKTVVSSAGTTTLAYDYEGRVTSISGPGMSNSFTYNGLDARVGKVDSAGTAAYRRDGAGVVAPVLSDGSAVYTPGVSQRRAGATTYDLADRLGTATKQTGSSAATTATRTYDAFGTLTASTGAPQGPFGFAGSSGYQEDGDSGLKLLGHRYYDPSTGRFLTRDPAKDGRNWYAYCEDNPLKSVDPEGLTDYEDTYLAGHLANLSKHTIRFMFDVGSGKHRRVYYIDLPPGSQTTNHVDADWVLRPDGQWVHIHGGLTMTVTEKPGVMYYDQLPPGEIPPGPSPDNMLGPGNRPAIPYPDPGGSSRPLIRPMPPFKPHRPHSPLTPIIA